MAFHELYALIANVLLVGVYVYLLFFFRKKYLEQKTSGFRNTFLLGYAFMFLFLSIYQIGQTLVDFYDLISESFSSVQLEQEFALMPDESIPIVAFVINLYRPIFIIGLIAMELLFAAQVYPVEIMVGWKRSIGSKIMIGIAISMGLLYITPVRVNPFSCILIYACFLGLAYGFVMNLAVNIKVSLTTTGEIKRRSQYIILASILFYLGFVWTLKVGWTELLIPALTSFDYDTVFGAAVIIVSSFLYRAGLIGKLTK